MDYKLAKELKDAGFPQGKPPATVRYDHAPDNLIYYQGEWVLIPTLSELIAACGEEFGNLGRYKWPSGDSRSDWLATQQYEAKNLGKNEKGEGSTPEEAVAKLWLSLRKNEQG